MNFRSDTLRQKLSAYDYALMALAVVSVIGAFLGPHPFGKGLDAELARYFTDWLCALLSGSVVLLAGRWIARKHGARRGFFGALLIATNLGFLAAAHSSAVTLLVMLVAIIGLRAVQSSQASARITGAVLLGLTIWLGWSAFIVALLFLSITHFDSGISSIRNKRCWAAFGAGVLAWLVVQAFQGVALLHPARTSDPEYRSILAFVFAFVVLLNPAFFCFRKKDGSMRRSAIPVVIIVCVGLIIAQPIPLFSGLLPLAAYYLVIHRTNYVGIALALSALNLLAFLTLPPQRTESQYGLSPEKRTESHDDIVRQYYWQETVPSLQRLQETETIQGEAGSLISDSLDVAILTHSTDAWFDETTLSARYPQCVFAMYQGRPLSRFAINGRDTMMMKYFIARPRIAALFERGFAMALIDSALPVTTTRKTTAHLELVEARTDVERHALLDRLIELYYHSGAHSH